MKNPLESLYEQILVTEAQTKDLTNPSHNQVSSLKANQEVFGEKPEVAKGGPDKAKVENGPSHKISTSSETAPTYMKSGQFKGTASAKPEKTETPEETTEPESSFTKSTNKTEDDSKEEKDAKKTEESTEEEKKKEEKKPETLKYNKQQENFTMSAFETLFKKTLIEELEPEMPEAVEGTEDASSEEVADSVAPEAEEEIHGEEDEQDEETEADLISDLKELHTKLSTILSKLEGIEEENEEESEEESEEEYSDEDFNDEFDTTETEENKSVVAKESLDKPKPFSDSKGKQLLSKKNKVGKVNPKGGKVHSGKFKHEPNPKAVSTKIANMTKGKPEVNSTVKKGEFIK
jgi:hypothetical protein